MLYFVCKAATCAPIWNFIARTGWRQMPFLRPITYEDLFHRRRAPRGHYIFTDFDRLTAYEIHCAAAMAKALQAADPAIRIYNHPTRVLERFPLLQKLRAEGLNSFGATRIDDGTRPTVWPVFIRCEDDCKRPDTGLLHNDAEFDAALADMAAKGVPLKRRIAVEYRAEVSSDGYFRKFGAVRIGGQVFLQHILRNSDWYVKHGMVARDEAADRDFITLFDNFGEHAAHLDKVFALAGIDFGRVDYAIVNGRFEVYEINTNPTISGSGLPQPGKKRIRRPERAARFSRMVVEGFRALNTPHSRGGAIRFELPKPVFQRFTALDIKSRITLALRWVVAAAMAPLLPPSPPLPPTVSTQTRAVLP